MSSNVWESTAERGSPGGVLPMAGALPKAFDVLNQTIQDLMKNFGGYLLAGLGVAVITFPVTLVAVLFIYAAVVVGVVFGAALDNEGIAVAGAFVGLLVGMIGMIGGIIVLTAPLTASLYRGMWAYLVRAEPLRFGAAFSTAFEDIGKILAYNLLVAAAVLVGAMFCYVPALAVSLGLHLALPALLVHRLTIRQAVALSVGHVRENIAWNLGAWALGIGVLLVSSQIPLLGIALGPALYASYQLSLYRAVFGDGEPAPA